MVPKPLQLLRHAAEADNHGRYSSEELLRLLRWTTGTQKVACQNNPQTININSQHTE